MTGVNCGSLFDYSCLHKSASFILNMLVFHVGFRDKMETNPTNPTNPNFIDFI